MKYFEIDGQIAITKAAFGNLDLTNKRERFRLFVPVTETTQKILKDFAIKRKNNFSRWEYDNSERLEIRDSIFKCKIKELTQSQEEELWQTENVLSEEHLLQILENNYDDQTRFKKTNFKTYKFAQLLNETCNPSKRKKQNIKI